MVSLVMVNRQDVRMALQKEQEVRTDART
ncbi:Protein of unknown function [Thermobacillus xylanilyticus]|uniref:Uncharacterized protein n=1 Tax=Thermobacillus xylanilyticus TaxID=76633 RepID=A0ABN7S6N1_THEXY|nr:Protein of unknown function [Thermobacillus xylanilyticus]